MSLTVYDEASPRLPSTSFAPAFAAADPLSFVTLFAVVRRRWRSIILAITLAVAASAAFAWLVPPRYTSEAQLMIDPRPHAGAAARDSRASGQPDAVLVDTEVKLVTSPAVLGAVVERLNLSADPEFAARKGAARPFDAVVAKLAKRLDVGRNGLTYIVSIRARSGSPEKAAEIANTLADEYLRQSRALRAGQAAEQARSLIGELGPLDREVLAADEAVARYRADHHIVSSGGANSGGTVTDQQIASMAAELGKAQADAAAATSAAVAATAQEQASGSDTVSQVLNSSALAELRRQRAQVLREQAQTASVYGPEHPALARINGQLAELDKAIKSESDHIVMGLQNDSRAAASRAAEIRAQLSGLEARQMQDAQASVVALGLQRNADAKRGTFNDLNRNAQEEAQEARIGDVRAWVVSAATRPLKPSFPNKAMLLVLGLMIGAAFGAMWAVVRELTESGFRSGEEVAAELRAPLLAAVPDLTETVKSRALWRAREKHPCWDYVLNKPVSSFSESIRNIRAGLLGAPGAPGPRAVCVTSALMGEGKSAIAVALARVMAMSGDRVLLVDCDLRRSGLSKLRTAQDTPPPSTGLMEVLEGAIDPHAAIVQDVVPGLSLLGLDSPVFTARDLFSGESARALIDRLKEDYDFIVLDAPPILAVTDAWSIASICDVTVMVVRHGKTARAAVRAAVDRLRLRGLTPGGVILNRRPPRQGMAVGYYDTVHAAYYTN
jgi:capsular exopolysaccharide synthesis family protein